MVNDTSNQKNMFMSDLCCPLRISMTSHPEIQDDARRSLSFKKADSVAPANQRS